MISFLLVVIYHNNSQKLRSTGCGNVDNWWKGKDLSTLVMENWIFVKMLDDWEELLHLDVRAEHIEKVNSVHGILLLKGLELDLGWWDSVISDWALDLV